MDTCVSEEPSSGSLLRFQAFLDQAKAIHALHVQPPSAMTGEPRRPMEQFLSFISTAKPLVAEQIRTSLQAHRRQLDHLCRWLIPQSCDILTAAGICRDEVRCTKLIAWMLWPEGQPQLALQLQSAWLKSLGLKDVASQITAAVEPQTEFATPSGDRADMVMHFQQPDFILIVEAKIDTEEHETPSSESQTQGYPLAVRQCLDVKENHPGAMVFLTPDGRGALGSEVITTTYSALLQVIAETASPDDLDAELRWAYAAAISHIFINATSGGPDGLDALIMYAKHGESILMSDEHVLKNLDFLGPLCRMLSSGGRI